jgi:hypothetical protein
MPLDQLPGSVPKMPHFPNMTGNPVEPTTNLLNLIVDVTFGFIGGLIIFFGALPVIKAGEHLAMELIKQTGYGSSPFASFGFTAAPYIVLAPVGGFALKEIASVRSIRGFLYFIAAVFLGLVIAYFTKGYFAQFIKPI